MSATLLIRDARLADRRVDVRIDSGRIAAIGTGLTGDGASIDARGGALIPGLADHHLHVLALAAQRASLALDHFADAAAARAALTERARALPPGGWLRATGYHQAALGEWDRATLDALAPDRPVRVQHQTGGLWVLNSAALAAIGADDGPDCVERDSAGRPSGRIWRGDAWLATRLPRALPHLAPVGAELARYGITHVTDTSPTTDATAAAHLAAAHQSGALPQHLVLMSGGSLPPSDHYRIGPVKLLFDEHDLPDFDEVQARIAAARAEGRCVAAHCVTATELAFMLAAFATAGTVPGDRIEHGGVIPAAAIATLRDLGLTVVTQSAFVRERGDRYLATVDPVDVPDLYRCASLIAAGVPVLGSSDAPYSDPNPWPAMRAAMDRRTGGGAVLGTGEGVSEAQALALYGGEPLAPLGRPRGVQIGAAADLLLLHGPLDAALAAGSAAAVAATIIAGRVVWQS